MFKKPRHENIPAFCICENQGADQLGDNYYSVFFFLLNTQIQPLFVANLKFQSISIFCGCKARFASDLVGNPENWFHMTRLKSNGWG